MIGNIIKYQLFVNHILFFFNHFAILFLYFFYFLAVLGLCFCARAFSSCGKRGPLFIAVRGPLTIAASLIAEHRLQTRRLSSCGSRAQLLRGMWDFPRPGLEPVSPALAGRFSTTVPPGKPTFLKLICNDRDFPGGPVVKNPPSNAGDAGSIPGQGTKIPHAAGQLGPRAATTEPAHSGACASQLKSSPRAVMKDPTCHNKDPMCHN